VGLLISLAFGTYVGQLLRPPYPAVTFLQFFEKIPECTVRAGIRARDA
jgi:hypothetical protein